MMTRNNKVVLGVAAGVAALAVAGMYAKKKGYLNNINANSIKDSLGGLKDTAMKAFNGSNESTESTSKSSTNGSSTKRKSTNTGTSGDTMNPATT